jgi:hypothetical protein
MLIAAADNETTIHARHADDPWHWLWQRAKRIVKASVEPWNPFVGAQRLAAAHEIQR